MTTITDAADEAFRTDPALAEFSGPVYFPGDPDLPAEISGFNLAAVREPAVVVGATSTADVAAAVRFAGRHGLPVGVLATGHGSARADGAVLITTRRMQDVHIDPVGRTARVAAGVRWSAVLPAAAEHGLTPLLGSTPDAGVVGYTLGGGLAVMGRTFGWAADRVLGMEVVTADGQIRDVDAEHDPDLFWALRGGKGGFGVVTAIEFELLELSETYGGGLYYPGESAREVLHTYRQWVATLPAEVNSSIALLRLPDLPFLPEPLRGRLSVHLRYAFVGDPQEGERWLAPMRAAATPVIDAVAVMPCTAMASIHNDPTEPMPAWDRGVLVDDLPEALVDALLTHAGPDVDVPLVIVEVRHLGGAFGAPAKVASAAGGRAAAFSVMVIGPLPPPLAEIVPALGNALLGSVAEWTIGTHPNFAGGNSDDETAKLAWDATMYERLQRIKARYDPADTFSAGFTVRPGR